VAVRFTGSQGVELAVDMAGRWDDPAVIMLHGGGQTRHSWGSTAAILADSGFLTITMDLRGHGESDWSPDGLYDIRSFADDLRELAAQLQRPVALAGASLGGLTSIIAAGEEPQIRCTALVLVDVTPRMNEKGKEAITAFMRAHPQGFATIEEAADAVATFLPHRSRPSDVSGLRKNLRRGDDGRWYWHWDPRMLSIGPGPGSAQPSDRYDRALQNVTAPILLVRGGSSEIVREEDVAGFRIVVPHAEYVDVPDAHHMVAGDRNDMFANAVIEFLDRHRGLPTV
jgi:pimeloyl-ACP methyl ester carboxylesterase